MKRLLTTGLVLITMTGATASFAQSKRTYDDDIYYNGKNTKQTEEQQPAARQMEDQPAQGNSAQRANDDEGATYSSSGDNYDARNDARNYDDDYVTYDDEYSYSTQINRFNYPFYNRPYWSTFYNPNWYDPYWVDPYWGWSPWVRPGFSVSFGAGPYWSSYWGWQSWYGCSGFNSYYSYPGYGMYGGYYSGYWNGYYAGLYNNYGYSGRYRAVTYGPRYSLNTRTNNFVHNAGFRSMRREGPNNNNGAQDARSTTPRTSGWRSAGDNTTRPIGDRNTAVQSSGIDRGIRNTDAAGAPDRGDVRSFNNSRSPVSEEAPRNNGWNNGGAARNEQISRPVEQPRQERSSWFGGRSQAPVRSNEQPQQRTFSQPRVERAAPAQRMETPSRSFGGGGRSSGGGGFHGGRR